MNDKMEKEFLNYWNRNQGQLVLRAPKALRDEYMESTQLKTPLDWICFLLPIAVGIVVLPLLHFGSEILSWAIMLVIVVVLFVLLQMLKPYFTKKASTPQVLDDIKNYYYEQYKKSGKLDFLEA